MVVACVCDLTVAVRGWPVSWGTYSAQSIRRDTPVFGHGVFPGIESGCAGLYDPGDFLRPLLHSQNSDQDVTVRTGVVAVACNGIAGDTAYGRYRFRCPQVFRLF